MSLRYDDALPTLIRIARDENVDLKAKGVVVLRDATGRLGVAFGERSKSNVLVAKMRQALGSYALAEPVLPTALYPTMEAAGPREVAIRVGDGDYQWIRLLDRRIVGSDWLSAIAPPENGPPRLVFGSLKGGVGRTTALAVLAADLAREGKRVLCIDLDVEAPGLGSILLRDSADDDRRPKYGALDYLVENGIGGINDDELFDFIGVSHFANGSIHVLPAVGRVTDDHPENMIGKLSRGLIEDVLPSERLSVAVQMRQMVNRFVSFSDYDAVLVDARAGLAEVTAGSWLALGARKLLLFGANRRQTFQDYRYVLSHLVQTLGVSNDANEDWRNYVAFVHSKAPSAGNGQALFRDRLYELCAETLYDSDEADEDEWTFNFGADETGIDVPHDATLITYHPDYDAFEPVEEETVLKEDVYGGPFGAFLVRAWRLLGLRRPE